MSASLTAGHVANERVHLRRQQQRLIYFSPVPFASYAQRPHFMVDAFVNSGFDAVLWIDPYPTRLPMLADFKRMRCRHVAAKRCASFAQAEPGVDARIRVVRPAALPIEPLPMSGWIHGAVAWRGVRAQMIAFAFESTHCVLAIGRPSKLAQWALEHVPHARSFVDLPDYFPAFYRGLSRLSMRIRQRALCRRVTDVYCSSSRLALDVGSVRRDALTVLNGYPTSRLPAPSSVHWRRYIGYIGSIADWFDWPLVQALAQALPDVTIRLIGPEFVARPRDLPVNIQLLGEVPNGEIASLVREFAVGLIPFRVNDLTARVDPIKFYEYRSMGVPVWSTAFGEMLSRGSADDVMHVSRESDWCSLWDAVCAMRVDVDKVESFRSEVDWSRRFEPVLTRSRIALGTPGLSLSL